MNLIEVSSLTYRHCHLRAPRSTEVDLFPHVARPDLQPVNASERDKVLGRISSAGC